MSPELLKHLEDVAKSVKILSMDAVQKANSGHPGLPMGCAEFGAMMYGHVLNHNPKNPKWLNRDRFILSAGHGSMFLYSLLHLSGFNLSLDEIKNFRQLHSKTPGHPEYHITPGVEATTGPLGQGVGNSIGQALGLKMLAATLNRPKYDLFNAKVYCLAGDGCLMEGVAQEASAFAGHLQLNNFILIHDANEITLDGDLKDSASEDVAMRYKAYGFDTYDVDGYDFKAMSDLFDSLKKDQKRPVYIRMKTIIGHGSPNKANSHKAHGSPLGPDEIKLVKQNLNVPEDPFYVVPGVYEFFKNKLGRQAAHEESWNTSFEGWRKEFPDLFAKFMEMKTQKIDEACIKGLYDLSIASPMATRSSSGTVLNYLAEKLPFLIGGSADLSGSDMTYMKKYDAISPHHFSGRNIKFGIREFGMAAIAAGLSETGLFRPFIGTFLTFSDYMRNAIRLSALSDIPVIYQFTHDSIFLGEDGPTHQSVEHVAALRAIPKLHVIRPCDSNEVKSAWLFATSAKQPTALILSRQNLKELQATKKTLEDGLLKGAYVLEEIEGACDFTLIATGSEVELALSVADLLKQKGKKARVVSMPCMDLFEKQEASYQQKVLRRGEGIRVSIEAGVSFGWHKWTGDTGVTIAVDRFGESAPASELAKLFGFTAPQIVDRLLKA
jgi:transketolase